MRQIFLILAFATITHFSMAQISYGVKGGLNVASLSFVNESYSSSPKIGFHLGGFGHYSINEQLGVQAEVFFSTEGSNWEFVGGSEGAIRHNQLRIPILVRYKIGEKLFLEAGPQYSFLLSLSQSVNPDDFEDFSSLYKSGLFGYALGASYDLENLLPGLAAGIRYNGAFSPINSEPVDAINIGSNVFQLNIFYTISK